MNKSFPPFIHVFNSSKSYLTKEFFVQKPTLNVLIQRILLPNNATYYSLFQFHQQNVHDSVFILEIICTRTFFNSKSIKKVLQRKKIGSLKFRHDSVSWNLIEERKKWKWNWELKLSGSLLTFRQTVEGSNLVQFKHYLNIKIDFLMRRCSSNTCSC